MKSHYAAILRGVRNRCSRRKERSPAVNLQTNASNMPVIRELIDSERTYLNYLQMTVQNFAKPLMEQQVLSRSESHILFGELESIYSINSVLMSNLQDDLIKALNDFLPFTKLYCSYAEKFERAQSMHMSKMKNDRKYTKFITTKEEQVGMKLDALLIMPIQRIPRYILLLSKLRDGHPTVDEVVQKLEMVTRQIDGHVVESKHTNDLLEVEKKLNFLDEIMVPGRKLLKSGTLYEVSDRVRFRIHVWLFSDIIVAGKKKVNGRYECTFVFPIRHCEIVSDVSNFSFSVRCREKAVTLTSDSYGISQSWILSIELTISQARACRSTLRKESSKQRPWKRQKTITQRVRTISRKVETGVISETSTTNEERSSLLSCFSCLGKRGQRPSSQSQDNLRTHNRAATRVQKNVPWWVTESNAT